MPGYNSALFHLQNYTVSQKVDHSTDGDKLVIAAVDLHPRMDKDEMHPTRP